MSSLLSFKSECFYSNFKFVCTTGMGEQGDDFTEFMPVSFEPKTPQASMELSHGVDGKGLQKPGNVSSGVKSINWH